MYSYGQPAPPKDAFQVQHGGPQPVDTAMYSYGQPAPPKDAFQVQHGGLQPWSTGLCDCTHDVDNCWMTCCCPCVTFGRITDIIDQGTTSSSVAGIVFGVLMCLTGCSWVYSFNYRKKMREQYSLAGSHCNDCLIHFFCEPCALCQEYRELENRGFDMNIGWQANMERRARVADVPPVPQDGMWR